MSFELSDEVKLFAHYSIIPPETYAKVGEFVCGLPLHMTFASIMTRQPGRTIEVLQDLFQAQATLPHMECEGVIIVESKNKHIRKPIMTHHDTAMRLYTLQRQLIDAVEPLDNTHVMPGTRYNRGRQPHVTIDQVSSCPQLPYEFDVDHLLVTYGTKIGPRHYHNDVLGIVTTDGAESVDWAA